MTKDELATQKMLTRLATDTAAIKAIVEQDHKAIFGNGQPGLLDRVGKLETKVAVIAALAGLAGGTIAEIIKNLF